jgi:cytoskeleton protein RodZ
MSDPVAAPGPRLKAERERRGLSAQKAADELHLDRWVIDALETGDYKRIGPTVYAKGHLKKYAALLGLPAAEILAGYESRAHAHSEAAATGPNILIASRADAPVMSNLSPMQIAACVVAVLLIVAVLLWRPWHQRGMASTRNLPPVTLTAAAAEKSRDAAVPVVREASPAPAETEASAPSAAPAAQDGNAAPPAAADAAAAPAAGAGHARIRLSFSADSWVDVHDASGKRTYAGNGLANSVKTIAGTAPMRVYLGFGSGVQLEINDRVVAIGPQFFAGDVARFEVGADGVLRRDSHADASRTEQTRGAQPHNALPPG